MSTKSIAETIEIAKKLEAAIADGAPYKNSSGTLLTFCSAQGCTHTGYYKPLDSGNHYCPDHLAELGQAIAQALG